MRTIALAATCASALLAGGCGETPEPPRDEPLVRLELTEPADAATVDADRVAVRGSVRPPGASVAVLGGEVDVEGGRFSAEVELDPGANLIDVAASAEGRRPDFASLRIVRRVRVELPDVGGRDADTAREELEGLGLEVDVEDAGGFFDPILPGDPRVCSMEPESGTDVPPGSAVVLRVAREC